MQQLKNNDKFSFLKKNPFNHVLRGKNGKDILTYLKLCSPKEGLSKVARKGKENLSAITGTLALSAGIFVGRVLDTLFFLFPLASVSRI